MNGTNGSNGSNGKGNTAGASGGRRLYVGNLPYTLDGAGLIAAFAEYGFRAERPHIVIDRETQRSKGFAFVELPTPEDAVAAVSQMDGANVEGRSIRVAPANDRPRESRPRQDGQQGQGGGQR